MGLEGSLGLEKAGWKKVAGLTGSKPSCCQPSSWLSWGPLRLKGHPASDPRKLSLKMAISGNQHLQCRGRENAPPPHSIPRGFRKLKRACSAALHNVASEMPNQKSNGKGRKFKTTKQGVEWKKNVCFHKNQTCFQERNFVCNMQGISLKMTILFLACFSQ